MDTKLKATITPNKENIEKKIKRIQFLTRELKKEISSISKEFKVDIE